MKFRAQNFQAISQNPTTTCIIFDAFITFDHSHFIYCRVNQEKKRENNGRPKDLLFFRHEIACYVCLHINQSKAEKRIKLRI